MDTAALIQKFHQTGASDIHLSVGNPPIMRIHGEVERLTEFPVLTAEDVMGFLTPIMNPKQQEEFKENWDLDFAVVFPGGGRFRVNAFYTLRGPATVLRGIPTQVRTLAELGVPDAIVNLTSLHKGLVLVTGPTGSGKSTTMSGIIDHFNQHHAKHILTIEDPVEFVHTPKKSLINQREVGAQTASFARALKGSLREDPDIILLGEMRDLETIQLAITAAETGHLVIGTLHTSSAAQTVDRIIDVFPSEDKPMIRTMLSNSLEAVVSQRLIKRKDGKGRVAAYEILLATSAVRNLIREGKIAQIFSVMQVNSRLGMRVMKDSVGEYLRQGVITQEAANEALNITDMGEGGGDIGGGGNSSQSSAPAPHAPSSAPAPRSGGGFGGGGF